MQAATIRECRLTDLDDIYTLLVQLWPGKELHKEGVKTVLERGLKSHTDQYYCAEIDNKVIGFCSIWIKNSFWQEGSLGYIGELVVDKPLRSQGIGTQLLKKAFKYAEEKGCKRIELDSAFSREEAIQFYETLGFIRRAYLFSRELEC